MAGRRFTLYFAWDAKSEQGANISVLENRYPALFEFRRAVWPLFEHRADVPAFRQDIGGFLEHVILSDFEYVRQFLGDYTGHIPRIQQRHALAIDQPNLLADDILNETDTLIVISLDHLVTAQAPTTTEMESVRKFLARPESCLVVCPHHDIGIIGPSVADREIEFLHHGDRAVPSIQRIGGYARHLLQALAVPIENQFGLSPAALPDGSPAHLLARIPQLVLFDVE